MPSGGLFAPTNLMVREMLGASDGMISGKAIQLVGLQDIQLVGFFQGDGVIPTFPAESHWHTTPMLSPAQGKVIGSFTLLGEHGCHWISTIEVSICVTPILRHLHTLLSSVRLHCIFSGYLGTYLVAISAKVPNPSQKDQDISKMLISFIPNGIPMLRNRS